MRTSLLFLFVLFAACGATQFNTRDPYADAGVMEETDAGQGGGGGDAMGGGGGAMGGGGGAMGGGGGAMGGGGGATGGGGGAMGGGGGSTGGGGGTTCGPATCLGCCANGVCQSTPSAMQCGRGGGACMACPAMDVCKTDGTCGLSPTSSWRIRPLSAVIDSSVAWDDTSSPDTVLFLWCPASAANAVELPKVQDDYTPSWSSGGCDLTAGPLLADGLRVGALEADILSDEILAPATTVVITEADLRAGTKTTGRIGGFTSITFSFTRQ